jgi:hypothetical protein
MYPFKGHVLTYCMYQFSDDLSQDSCLPYFSQLHFALLHVTALPNVFWRTYVVLLCKDKFAH